MKRHATINLQHKAAPAGRPAVLLTAVAIALLGLGASRADATVDNTATATGTYNAATITSNSDTASVDITPSSPQLSVVKTAAPSVNVAVGTVVTYTYQITNTGNTTVSNVALSDAHNGSGTPPVPGSELLTADTGTTGDSTDATANDGIWSALAPGDTVTFTSTYAVTQNDVDTKQ
jgi:large repetitive protein